MPTLNVNFAEKPPVDLGSPAPGVHASAQEADVYAVDVAAEPRAWTDGRPVHHLLNTMAKIAGQLTPGRTFNIDRTWRDGRVTITLYLTPDKMGARLWTEPIDPPRDVFEEWWKRNVIPPVPPDAPTH